MLLRSNMLALGTIAPDFALVDMNDNRTIKTFDELAGINGTFIIFICNHCPYVQHIFNQLLNCFKFAKACDLGTIAINSNDPNQYPADSELAMQKLCATYNFTYLFDANQQVAKTYQAACTPDCFLFDENGACVYRGRFDASNPNNGIPSSGADILYAIQLLITKQPIQQLQQPSLGCSIKWKL